MSVNDVYKVTMVFQDNVLDRQYSTGYYIVPDAVSVPDVADVEDVCVSWWDTQLNSSTLTAGMKGLYEDTLSLVNVTFRQWNPLAPTIEESSAQLPIVGTNSATDSLPPQNAIVASLRTGNIGRSYRGRMYLPPITEVQSAEKISDATALAIAKQTSGLFKEWLARTTDHCTPVVFSPTLKVSIPDGTPITQVKVDSTIRSQRRRSPRTSNFESAGV